MPKKILLLNPPGDRLYVRDQFCSLVSKGTYCRQPVDLLMVAARLHAEGCDLEVVDAIAERLAPDEARRLRRLGSLVELQNHVGNGLSSAGQSLRPAPAPRP